jgi:NAD(P)-dependent dehydrogenase (short-subunit alcohol dehydrogenase family)
MFSLDGQVVIVTGGTGHLGTAICEGIHRSQGTPVSVSRTRIPDAHIPYILCDVDTDFPKVVDYVLDAFGQIDGLVNIVGDVRICTEAVKDQVSVIANCASLWSSLAPNPSMYLDLGNEPKVDMVAKKGEILALTKYYASFLSPKVRVNAFTPGWFPKKRGPERPDYLEEITSRIPLGRIGVPDDIVGTVLFLLSDASRFMTGQNLVVDGGYSIW